MDLKISNKEGEKKKNFKLSIMDTMVISALKSELNGKSSMQKAIQNIVNDFNEVHEIINHPKYPLLNELKVRYILKKAMKQGYCFIVKNHANKPTLLYF